MCHLAFWLAASHLNYDSTHSVIIRLVPIVVHPDSVCQLGVEVANDTVVYNLSFFFFPLHFSTEPRFREETTQTLLFNKKKDKDLDEQLLLAAIQAPQL